MLPLVPPFFCEQGGCPSGALTLSGGPGPPLRLQSCRDFSPTARDIVPPFRALMNAIFLLLREFSAGLLVALFFFSLSRISSFQSRQVPSNEVRPPFPRHLDLPTVCFYELCPPLSGHPGRFRIPPSTLYTLFPGQNVIVPLTFPFPLRAANVSFVTRHRLSFSRSFVRERDLLESPSAVSLPFPRHVPFFFSTLFLLSLPLVGAFFLGAGQNSLCDFNLSPQESLSTFLSSCLLIFFFPCIAPYHAFYRAVSSNQTLFMLSNFL